MFPENNYLFYFLFYPLKNKKFIQINLEHNSKAFLLLIYTIIVLFYALFLPHNLLDSLYILNIKVNLKFLLMN